MSEIYEAGAYEPRKAVGYLVNRLRAELVAAIDRELLTDEQLSSMEVSYAQFAIVASLGLGAAKSASDLCKYISYDAGAMTRMIDRLEEKGLLQRSRDANDRRLINLELTQKGADALPRMKEVSRRVVNRFLEGFTKAEARQLEGLLSRMLENAPRES